MAVTSIDKESYMLYRGWNPLFENLPKEQLGELFYAICCYQSGKEYTIENPLIKGVFEMVLMQFKKDEEKYISNCEAKAKNGKKGAESRWQDDNNNTSENGKNGKCHSEDGKNGKCYFSQNEEKTEMAKMAIEEEEEVEDKEEVEEVPTVPKKREARKRFSPPSAAEVREYCRERENTVDAESFVDFYAAKGWKVGNAPMKDWKAAVRTWEKRESRAAPRRGAFDANDYLLGIIGEEGA
nr:DUF6291 domain-containing protein [uncultured Oribacterium sp.]